MSINQMKTVNNLEALKGGNKQTSFRQSYTGVNSSNGNIAYNNYNSMHNYSSLTNSSNKPMNTSEVKDNFISQKANNYISNDINDGISGSICPNQILEDRLKEMALQTHDSRQRSQDSRIREISHTNDVEMDLQD